jgi:hypothetical protein
VTAVSVAYSCRSHHFSLSFRSHHSLIARCARAALKAPGTLLTLPSRSTVFTLTHSNRFASLSPLVSGEMNGLSMTIVAAVRTFTPLGFGWVYDVSISAGRPWPLDVSLVFTLIAAVMLHTGHISSVLPPSIERQCK